MLRQEQERKARSECWLIDEFSRDEDLPIGVYTDARALDKKSENLHPKTTEFESPNTVDLTGTVENMKICGNEEIG